MIPPHKLPQQSNGGAKNSTENNNGTGPIQNQAQQPPLGRNASAGDTQPQLAARQISGGVRLPPFVGTNGAGEASPAGGLGAQLVATGGARRDKAPRSRPAPTPARTYPATAPGKGVIFFPTQAQRDAYEREMAEQEAAKQAPHPPAPPRQPPAPVAAPRPSPAAQGPAAKPPAPSEGGMRELRVEDALLYLDEVKRQFGDRPRVYNEFLGIMKNFKSQEVDTPGVIARVSKLFRGYNNLILGFNKFLPTGYKISIEDIQMQEAIFGKEDEAREQASRAASSAAPVAAVTSAVPPAAPSARLRPIPQLPHQIPSPAPGPVQYPPQQPAAQSVPPKPPVPQMGQQGVPRGRPPIQGSEPMRKPVVDQKLETRPPQPSNKQQQPQSTQGRASRPMAKYTPPAGMVAQPHPAAPAPPPPQHQPPPPPQHQPPMAAPPQRAPPPRPRAAQPPQTVEFDHAISYVTTIKRRFANDPSTYHAFLEILHTYQTEQRGIKDVLEKVAHLFQDHPDLLKEFTFFLPDAVQDQAKERLHRAAADSEARQAAKRAQMEQDSAKEKEKPENMEVDTPDSKANHQKFIDMTGQQAAAAGNDQAQRSKKRTANEQSKETPVPIALPQQPEAYVYNAAVERQFFDSAREALMSFSRDGGQAWAEFLKCLDMYAQEILSRNEMLAFVEPLLGKRNTKLFEEFKRILAAAGAQAVSLPFTEDSWHSVPLSEIDFSRCRRCSPSYRALPRDYPLPPCSERGDEENKVLNNVWVSLPVGSEESYTFRHMRRNTYEEILFRCEDERFEIDMVIDSNAATLARLEPIAEEISQLAENELVMLETSTTPKPAPGDHGLGGKKYQYSFDKSILGVIHRNSITRIYGDAGQEMLELIVKNPTVAVPLVVERLRQKDREWRVVRNRLNLRWRELAEHNYYRSLDHRSLTWRTTDKRAISTRTLVSEIKDRAAHDGSEGQAAFQARLDKAKEEHGAFYEVTMGAALKRQLDLTNLPKPDRRIFTPHLSLMHENTNWVHRDAYRILSFALERGSISPTDKERCHRLWTEFLGPWFGLSMYWMFSPSVAFQESSKPIISKDFPRVVGHGDDSPHDEDEEESLDDDGDIHTRVVTEDVRNTKPSDRDDSPSYIDHHPLPAGSTVSTIYGEGRIIKCRKTDDIYVVSLPFGTAYLRPSSILCSIPTVEKSSYTTQLRADDRKKLERPDDMLAIGTQSLYLFFRLHDILIKRLSTAKQVAYSVKDDGSLINMVEQMPGDDAAALGRKRYDAFLSLVYALLDGGNTLTGSAAEGGKFEDRVRCLLGHGGYELATMDKLISHILKNLQTMANDETMWNLIHLFRRHLDAGSFKPEAFRQEAAYMSDGEPMYAFQSCPLKDEDKTVLHMEYLGVISEAEDEDASTGEPTIEAPPSKRHKRDK